MTKIQPAHGNVDSSTTFVLRFDENPAGSRKRRFQYYKNRILRTRHAPVPRGVENYERVVDREQNSEDAPRASAARGQKPREGRRSRTDFARRSTRQRGRPPKTARGFAIHVQNSHGATTGAIRRMRNPQRVRRRRKRFAVQKQNSEDAPRASAARGRKLREGRRSRADFRRRSTCQRREGPKTTRGSSIANRIRKTLHAPARAPAKNSEGVRNSRSKVARRHNGSDSTRTIPAEGSLFMWKIRTAPQWERLRARSPQRVRRRRKRFARRHNGSGSTRTIPAKGSTRVFKKFARLHNGSDATRTKPALRRFPLTRPWLLKTKRK